MELVERVFNSAVTAMECVTDQGGNMVLFAGSKDGIIKVIISNIANN